MQALLIFGLLHVAVVDGLQVSMKNSINRVNDGKRELSRRSFVSAFVSTATALSIPAVSNAGIDMNDLKALPVEGDNSGVATRLRQIEAEKNRPEDTVDKVRSSLQCA